MRFEGKYTRGREHAYPFKLNTDSVVFLSLHIFLEKAVFGNELVGN
jgi:hypothetical protein